MNKKTLDKLIGEKVSANLDEQFNKIFGVSQTSESQPEALTAEKINEVVINCHQIMIESKRNLIRSLIKDDSFLDNYEITDDTKVVIPGTPDDLHKLFGGHVPNYIDCSPYLEPGNAYVASLKRKSRAVFQPSNLLCINVKPGALVQLKDTV